MNHPSGYITLNRLYVGLGLSALVFSCLVFTGCSGSAEPQVEAHIPGTIVTEGIEVKATYGNNESDLNDYLDSALVFPSEAKANRLKNRVRMMFIVQEDGHLTAINAQDESDPALIAEAERVLSEMPAWNPAQKHGHDVATWNFATLLFTRTKKHIAAKGKPGARPTDFIPFETESSNWNSDKYQPTVNRPVLQRGDGFFHDDKGPIYVEPDLTVSFPGGVSKALNTIHDAIQYPEEARAAGVVGEVRIVALIDAAGKVEDSEVVLSVGYGCDEEALRIVRSMNNWIPAMHDGESVRSIVFIPVDFRLE